MAPGLPPPADDHPAPEPSAYPAVRGGTGRFRTPVRQVGEAPIARCPADLGGILELFGEHVYTGQIGPAGEEFGHATGDALVRFLGGSLPAGVDPVRFWASRVHLDDREAYERFHERLRGGGDAEVTFRLVGVDGVTRVMWDRGRTRPGAGGVHVTGVLTDVTSRREVAEKLALSSELFNRLLAVVGAHVYVAIAYADGRLVELFQGPGADKLLGGGDPDPDMVNWDAAVHPDDRDAYDDFNAELAAGRSADVEYRLRGADGVTRWVHDRAVAHPNGDGSFEVSGIVSDVTERRRMRDELEQARQAADLLARTDELTGTYNRRHFSEIIETALATSAEECALLLLDADHFKHVNDVYGHLVGDAVLVEFARRLQGALGPRECLARWGGEEFAVLLRGVHSDAELHWRADRLRNAIALTPIDAAGISLRLTASLGAVRAGGESTTLDALVDAADRCLYDAKRHGRNRVSLIPHLDDVDRLGEPEAVRIARALALVAGAQEHAPQGHAEQVSDLSARTAQRLGLPVDIVLRCRLGGWLHDIGKATIPASILDKPGRLDDDEWAVMRTHPGVGEAIVREIAGLRDASFAVRHHHERFDGAGYPDGLAGHAIPIEARIVAAADAYAAITGVRVYSPARSPEDAAVELRRSAGSHFDPNVVDALLDILGLPGEADAQVA